MCVCVCVVKCIILKRTYHGLPANNKHLTVMGSGTREKTRRDVFNYLKSRTYST